MKKKIIISALIIMILVVGACTSDDEPEVIIPEPSYNNEVPVQEEFFPDVLANVNGEEITKAEAQSLQRQIQIEEGRIASMDELVNLLAENILLVQEAKRRGYEVSTEEVEALIEEEGIDLKDFKASVEMQGLDYEDFLVIQKNELILYQMFRDIIESVEISEEEIVRFYEEEAIALGEERTIEEARENIVFFLTNKKVEQKISVFLESLKEQSNIEIYY